MKMYVFLFLISGFFSLLKANETLYVVNHTDLRCKVLFRCRMAENKYFFISEPVVAPLKMRSDPVRIPFAGIFDIILAREEPESIPIWQNPRTFAATAGVNQLGPSQEDWYPSLGFSCEWRQISSEKYPDLELKMGVTKDGRKVIVELVSGKQRVAVEKSDYQWRSEESDDKPNYIRLYTTYKKDCSSPCPSTN